MFRTYKFLFPSFKKLVLQNLGAILYVSGGIHFVLTVFERVFNFS